MKYQLIITKTAVIEVDADSLEEAVESGLTRDDEGTLSFNVECEAEPVEMDSRSNEQWKRVLSDEHNIDVYASNDNPGCFGFTGCESDDFESEHEAIEAALIGTKMLVEPQNDPIQGYGNEAAKNNEKSVYDLRDEGFAVVVFSPEELKGADVKHVCDRLIELGNDVIDALDWSDVEIT